MDEDDQEQHLRQLVRDEVKEDSLLWQEENQLDHSVVARKLELVGTAAILAIFTAIAGQPAVARLAKDHVSEVGVELEELPAVIRIDQLEDKFATLTRMKKLYQAMKTSWRVWSIW